MLVIQTTFDELHRNWKLFHFLSFRSSAAVFVKAVEQFPNLDAIRALVDDEKQVTALDLTAFPVSWLSDVAISTRENLYCFNCTYSPIEIIPGSYR